MADGKEPAGPADGKSDRPAYWRHWKLDAASLVPSFAELSQNMETERDEDTVTASFVCGGGTTAVVLYEHVCVSIAPLPSS